MTLWEMTTAILALLFGLLVVFQLLAFIPAFLGYILSGKSNVHLRSSFSFLCLSMGGLLCSITFAIPSLHAMYGVNQWVVILGGVLLVLAAWATSPKGST